MNEENQNEEQKETTEENKTNEVVEETKEEKVEETPKEKSPEEKGQEMFNEFLNNEGWKFDQPYGKYLNFKKNQIKEVHELVEDFKKSLIPKEEVKAETKTEAKVEETTTEKKKEVKRISEKEGIEKLRTHPYKGVIEKYDVDAKKNTMMKKVKLLDINEKVQEEFCFLTHYIDKSKSKL